VRGNWLWSWFHLQCDLAKACVVPWAVQGGGGTAPETSWWDAMTKKKKKSISAPIAPPTKTNGPEERWILCHYMDKYMDKYDLGSLVTAVFAVPNFNGHELAVT